MDKRYIEEDLGLESFTDAGGNKVYGYPNNDFESEDFEGFFIEKEDKSGWIFIPDEPINYVVTREMFEIAYR